jgi:hypothetical protein
VICLHGAVSKDLGRRHRRLKTPRKTLRVDSPHIGSSRIEKLQARRLETHEHVRKAVVKLDPFFGIVDDLAPLPVRHVHLLQRSLALLDPRIVLPLGKECLVLCLNKCQRVQRPASSLHLWVQMFLLVVAVAVVIIFTDSL